MSYSSLLVHVDVDGEIGGRVRLAAGLADQFHSHLIGVASCMARPPFVAEGFPSLPEPTEEDYQEIVKSSAGAAWNFVAAVGPREAKPNGDRRWIFRPNSLRAKQVLRIL